MKNHPQRRIGPPGFTLVELLVVIAIIGILAGFIVYLLPSVHEKKVRGRVKTELALINMAINSYKARYGFFPPDNPNNTAQPQLYYELTGTKRIIDDSSGAIVFEDVQGRLLSTNVIGTYFLTAGFLNSGDERQNFLTGLKAGGSNPAQPLPGDPNIRLLVVPYKGPSGDYNPWRYNSSSPTHNPEGFDLWAEVVIGSKTNLFGNWKE